MALTCPNINHPDWKALAEAQEFPYTLWNKYNGNVPSRFFLREEETEEIDRDKATSFLNRLFPGKGVNFYENAKNIGNKTTHGYVANAAFYLSTSADVGTEYHEGYHMMFRTMLSDVQREILYREAEREFGKPTEAELNNLRKSFPGISDEEVYNLALEEKMAENFREYMLSEEESGKTLGEKIRNWFKNLFAWIKAIVSDDLSLQQVYSLMKSNNVNKTLFGRKVFRNPQEMHSTINPRREVEGIPAESVEAIVDGLANMAVDEIENWGNEDADIGLILGNSKTNGSVVNNLLFTLYKFKDPILNKKKDGPSKKTLSQAFALERAYEDARRAFERNPKNKDAEKAMIDAAAAFKTFIKSREVSLNNYPKIKEDGTEREKSLAMAERQRRAYVFHVIDNWNGRFSAVTGNTLVPSWREAVERELLEFGYTVKSGKVIYNDVSDTDLDSKELEAMDGIEEKIYDKSHFSESAAKRLTQMAKLFLRRIPVLTTVEKDGKFMQDRVMNKIFTDKPMYHDTGFVFKQLSELWADTRTYREMEAKLIAHADIRPDLSSIKTKINSLDAQQKAVLYNAFANSITQFKYIIFGENSRVLNANSSTTESKIMKSWRSNAVEIDGQEFDSVTDNSSLYIKTINEEDDSAKFRVKESSLKKIKEYYSKVEQFATRSTDKTFQSDKGVTEPAIYLGSLIWNLGMTVGVAPDIQQTIYNVQTLLNTGLQKEVRKGVYNKLTPKQTYLHILDKARLYAIVDSMVTVSKKDNKVTYGAAKTDIVPFFETEKKGVKFLASLAPIFASRSAEMFVNPLGEAQHPVNNPVPIDDKITEIKADLAANGKDNAFQLYRGDAFMFNANGPSHIFKHLLENPEYVEQLSADTLSAINVDDEGYDIEDFNDLDEVLSRMYQFINNGNKKFYYAVIPAMGDRPRRIFLLMPRIKGNGPTLDLENTAQAHKNLILEDFFRMNAAKKVIADPNAPKIDGYHTGENPSALNDKYMQLDMNNREGQQIVQNFEIKSEGVVRRMSDVVESYVKAVAANRQLNAEQQVFHNNLEKMLVEIQQFYSDRARTIAQNIVDQNRMYDIDEKWIKTWAGRGVKKKGKGIDKKDFVEVMIPLLREFLIHEDLGRFEAVKLFRGNRALYKTLENLTKRQRLLSTPGTKPSLKNTFGDPNDPKADERNYVSWRPDEAYGANPTFTDFTFLDPQLNITKNILGEANKYVERNKEKLASLKDKDGNRLYTDDEIAFMDSYLPNSFEETDGLAVISMYHYRSLMEGNGQWHQYHEIAFQNYLKTGEFLYPEGIKLPAGKKPGQEIATLPMKPSYDGTKSVSGVVVAEIQKTAYIVLKKSYTKNFPIMDDIRQRMELNTLEADNPYLNKDLKRLDVAHAKSAKKGPSTGAYDFSKNLDEDGRFIPGSLTDVILETHNTANLRFPQTIPGGKNQTKVTLNRQVKKTSISNVVDDATYWLNPGLPFEFGMQGASLKYMYHGAIEELLNRNFEAVSEEIGLNEFKKAINKLTGGKNSEALGVVNTPEFAQAKLKLLKKVRAAIERQALERDLDNNFLDALNITIDPITKIPRFSIPLDYPVFGKSFQTAILSLYNNNVFKQKLSGYEAVQTGLIGGFATDTSLKFLEIVDHPAAAKGVRLAHAEIMVRQDALRRFGLAEGEITLDQIPEELRRVIGYRIPNQDKASMVILKIKAVLDDSYEKAIVVPPQLVKLMGSDYDVDKMFLFFPELEQIKDPKTKEVVGMKKVVPDYFNLSLDFDNQVGKLTDKELNNIIVDTMEAVLSSPEHFLETLAPLDTAVLGDIRKDILKILPNLTPSEKWSGGEYETNSSIRSLLSIKLKGLHSNALAGRNVLVEGSVNVYDGYAIKIEGEKINRKILKEVPKDSLAKFDAGVKTDKIVSRYVTAAVDATAAPYHYILKDNVITFPVITYWNLFNGDTELLHFFLNQPVIADFLTIMSEKYNNNLSSVNYAYKEVIKKHNIDPLKKILASNYKKIKTSHTMSREKIMSLNVANEVALANFMKFYTAGTQLKAVMKAVTPDTSSGINRLEAMQAYLEVKDAFENPSQNEFRDAPMAFYAPGLEDDENVVNQFIGENSVYGLERGYHRLIEKTFQAAAVLFPATVSAEVTKFKNGIKFLTGKPTMTIEQHRDVNAAIIFTILSREESPLFRFFNKSFSSSLYKPSKKSGEFTLSTRIKQLVKKYPNLAANEFLSKIEDAEDNAKNAGFKTIQFDATQQYSVKERSRIKSDLNTLMYMPQAYLGKKPKDEAKLKVYNKDADTIKALGFDLAIHTLISNGFRKSAFNYASMLPTRFLTEPIARLGEDLDPISISEYLHDQFAMMNSGRYFTPDDLRTFFRIFGEVRPGGANLVDRKNFDNSDPLEKEITFESEGGIPQKVIVIKNKKYSDIYMLDEKNSSDRTLKYLSLYKTGNNKKHIVGGDWINKKTVGNVPVNEMEGIFSIPFENESFDSIPTDVTQICMLPK